MLRPFPLSDLIPQHPLTPESHLEKWNSIWQPQVQERLRKLIDGNLTLRFGDVNLIPYLCGFESQMAGRLSPFCDVFTDEGLKMYQYSNDLCYYYGIGSGTDLPSTMMTPSLDSLVDLLVQGPGIEGVSRDDLHHRLRAPHMSRPARQHHRFSSLRQFYLCSRQRMSA